MKRIVALAALVLVASPVSAQTDLYVQNANGATTGSTITAQNAQRIQLPAVQLRDVTGAPLGTSANPLVTSGGGGGGGSNASVGTNGTTAPTSSTQVAGAGPAGNLRALAVDTGGALTPPTALITQTAVTVAANTSTQLVTANANRIALEIQCDGTAAVGIGRQGATLTSVASAGLVIPSGSYPLYVMPYASQTAITAYTGTAQTCRVTEYARQ